MQISIIVLPRAVWPCSHSFSDTLVTISNRYDMVLTVFMYSRSLLRCNIYLMVQKALNISEIVPDVYPGLAYVLGLSLQHPHNISLYLLFDA